MNLPTWQKNIITALAHYGGYLGVTTGSTSASLSVGANNLEDSQAWSYAGVIDPFWSWLRGQSGVAYVYGTTGSDRYQVNIFGNIPLVNGTNILHHIHMADPCVAKSLAHQSGGCL